MSNETKFKIGVKRVGRPIEFVEIPERIVALETLNEVVGGYIETLPFTFLNWGMSKTEGAERVLIILDEEGKLKGKDVNLSFLSDFLVGDLAFVSMDGEEMVALSDKEIEVLRNTDRLIFE